jgi:hypothetical protein
MIETKIVEFEPQHYGKLEYFFSDEVVGTKALKSERIYNSTVTIDDLVFDADEKSMDRMVRVIQVANWNATRTNDYSSVFNQTIDWKLNNNTVIPVTLEQLARALEASINLMSSTWLE